MVVYYRRGILILGEVNNQRTFDEVVPPFRFCIFTKTYSITINKQSRTMGRTCSTVLSFQVPNSVTMALHTVCMPMYWSEKWIRRGEGLPRCF